ncbi:MAG: DUF1295 domain-containing protein [bacterium]|nr:DUF1295 domain-containing protein [bacterium]
MVRNIVPRILLAVIVLIPLVFFMDFFYHFHVYLTGNVITRIVTEQWHIVVLSILLFLAFLIPLSFRRKANWMEYGVISAFFVSLFIEMYGIPLTIIFASKYFFTADAVLPDNVVNFTLFGVGLGMDTAMLYSAVLMVIGALLILVGWVTLYRNIKKQSFVTKGIYAYSRHPQYLGFILIIIGWFIGWPTILTLIFTPILVYKYVKVCKTEEKEIQKKNVEYRRYMWRVPFFV